MDSSTVAHDRHDVADLKKFFDEMSYEQDAEPGALQLPHDRIQAVLFRSVQYRRGLVQYENRRAAAKGLRDLDHLLLMQAELTDPLPNIYLDTHPAEDARGTLLHGGGVQPERPRMLRSEEDVLVDGKFGHQREFRAGLRRLRALNLELVELLRRYQDVQQRKGERRLAVQVVS